jgi:putative flippase GtrA
MIFDRVLLKFIIAGVINTIVGSCVMFVLYNIGGFSYWVSSAANYVTGSVLSFFLNKYWTFRVRKWSLYIVIAFIANIAICYGIAYGIAKPAMNYLLRNNSIKIRENAALFTGMCLFTGLNYLGQRFVVFKYKKEKKNET